MRSWLLRYIRAIAVAAALVGSVLQFLPLMTGLTGWPAGLVRIAGASLMSLGIGILVGGSRWARRRRAEYEWTRAHERELGERQARERQARERAGGDS